MTRLASLLLGMHGIAMLLLPPPAHAQTPEHGGLRSAIQVYESGDFPRAMQLMEAIQPSALSSRDQAIRDLFRGFIFLAYGDETQAEGAMESAVSLDATVRPDPALHSPSRLEFYERVRSEWMAGNTVERIEVEGTESDLLEGATAMFSVRLFLGSGQEVRDRPVRWSVSDPEILSVSGDGVVRALRPGTADVVAEAEGGRGVRTLTVRSAVGQVTVGDTVISLAVGEERRVQARVVGTDGGEMNLGIEWRSSSPGVASVSEGRIRGVAPGTATIRAEAGGQSRAIAVVVAATGSRNRNAALAFLALWIIGVLVRS